MTKSSPPDLLSIAADTDVPRTSVTALVSWAHRDPEFTYEQRLQREARVVQFVQALRNNGIDADVDVFHEHESVDWTRWGPGRMAEVDVVLVICSIGWNASWDGQPVAGRGATAEANVIRSWFQHEPDRFQQSVRLVVLPDEDRVIPVGLDGLVHHQLTSFDAAGMEALLGALTDQPRFTPAPLGSVPVLPLVLAVPVATPITPVTARYGSPNGDLTVSTSIPEGLPVEIESAIDEFLASEQRDFEENEGAAADLQDLPNAVVNHSSIKMTCWLDDRLVSVVSECSYVAPGAAISYQKTVGLTFRRSDGYRLALADPFVAAVSQLASLREAFIRHARIQVGDAVDVDELPPAATLAVSPVALGICTSRYDIGPGYLGASVIWIPHKEIARLYQPGFARVLPRIKE